SSLTVVRSIAPTTLRRGSDGAASSAAVVEKTTSPTRTYEGRSATNFFATSCAALRRFGSTSFAPIDLDGSTATTSVALFTGTATERAGRAVASTMAANVSMTPTRVATLRQAGRPGAIHGSSAGFVNCASARTRCRSTTRATTTAATTTTSNDR